MEQYKYSFNENWVGQLYYSAKWSLNRKSCDYNCDFPLLSTGIAASLKLIR